MKDADCVEFLQWALPRLGLRWPGFRKVRRQVCKRVSRRMKALGLAEIGEYRLRLDADPAEWRVLDAACRITVSRFYRDAEVFAVLRSQVMPALAETAHAERRPVRCWCAGCASGEEVYTLTILWAAEIAPSCRDVEFEVIGTDAEPAVLRRAERGCFSPGSLKDLPSGWRERAFAPSIGAYCIADAYRRSVSFLEQDIREQAPPGPFDLVLCRNLAFTYFDGAGQRAVLDRITAVLRPGGYLVIGSGERLPDGEDGYRCIAGCREILRRQNPG